ncbi:Xylulose kinase [Streptomyces glaucescens]
MSPIATGHNPPHISAEAAEEGEPDVSSRGSARRRRGHVHAVHQGAGRRRGDRTGRGERPGAAHRARPEPDARATRGKWWDALGEALRQCGDAAREAAAVSIGGQQHGLVTLDERGEPVRPALLWNDVRSAPQARRLTEELGGAKFWAERTGSVPAASFTVTEMGLARGARAGGRPRHQGGAAPARLPHRAAHRRRARPTAATPPGPAGGRRAASRTTPRSSPMSASIPRCSPAWCAPARWPGRCGTVTTCRSREPAPEPPTVKHASRIQPVPSGTTTGC